MGEPGQDGTGTDRRTVLAVGAAAVATTALAGEAGARTPADGALRQAFTALLDPSTRESLLAEQAVVIDSDAPFPMTRAEHADHLSFHRPLWEARAFRPYDVRVQEFGGTAIVTAYLMDRGKPKNAGFRIRPIYCTAVFARAGAGWRAVGLHIGSLNGQLIDISPG